MRTREISHERWAYFLGDFTHLHHGQRVNVETIDRRDVAGVRSKVHDLPLVGIMGSDPDGGCSECIEIIAGDSPDTQSVHAVAHPARVVIGEEDNGQGVALQIDSADGSITMVRFEPSVECLPAGFTLT